MRAIGWMAIFGVLSLATACATASKVGGAAAGEAAKETQGQAAKGAGDAQAKAEQAKAQALKDAFAQALASHEQRFQDLKSRLERYEGSYQGFAKASNKKVQQAKPWKDTQKDHDALLPKAAELASQHDALLAWAEGTKETPTDADVQKINADFAALLQTQGQHIAKYGEWHTTMESLKAKHKLKVALEKVETEAADAAEEAPLEDE